MGLVKSRCIAQFITGDSSYQSSQRSEREIFFRKRERKII